MKKVKIILIIIFVVILFESNKRIIPNRKEINELELIKIIGMDNVEEDEELVSLTFVRNKSEEAGGGSASGGNQETETKKQNVITAEAPTFMGAVSAMQTFTNKEFAGGHVKYFVLGEGAAKSDINKYTDFIFRDTQLRMNGKIFIVQEETAKKMLDEGSSKDYKLDEKFKNMEDTIYETSNFKESTIADLLKILESESKTGVAPALKLMKVGEATEQRWKMENTSNQDKESSEDEYDIIFGGYAIIKDGKVIGFLNNDESRGYNFLTNTIKSADITIFDQENKLMNLNVVKSQSNISFEFDGEKLKKIFVNIDVYSDINEIQSSENSLFEEAINYAEGEQTKIVKQEVGNVIDAAKKYKADFLEIGKLLNLKHPYKWKKIKDNWEQIFAETEIEINVKSKAQRTFDIRESTERR